MAWMDVMGGCGGWMDECDGKGDGRGVELCV